jgi:signal transduction histidine kinase
MTIDPLRQSTSLATPIWIRWMPLWHSLFYLSLTISTGIALFDNPHTWQYILAVSGLSLLLGLWYMVCVILSPLLWRKHPLLTIGYFVIGWAIWFLLSQFDPSYLIVLTGLYPQVFSFPTLLIKILGAFLLTFMAAWLEVLIIGGLSVNLFITLAAAAAGIITALFINAIVDQSQKRQRLIDELEATRNALAIAERQAGITHERQRLAHEIHDTLAQGFTSIIMHLEAAETLLPAESSALRNHIDQARRTARENLVETRRLLYALQPVILDHATFSEALTQLTAHWEEVSGICASISITGTSVNLRPEIEVTLLRTAQEALANARKHASASSVTLTLSYMDDTVALDVQDNGVGFDTERLCFYPLEYSPGGFGLKALSERIKQMGGTFSVESELHEGTTIAVSLPAISLLPSLTITAPKEAS